MLLANPRIFTAPPDFRAKYDRQPFGYEHQLSGLDLFSEGSLRALAARYDRNFFVAAGARSPDTAFYAVPNGEYRPVEAFDRLDSIKQRILLKSPENYDPRYRELLDAIFDEVSALRGGLGGERIVRLASSILISSAASITPFHFDPEISFFFQISGAKTYHLYEAAALSEAELERFYVAGIVDIGQVAFAGRDPAYEHAFELAAGKGMHQPQNCPHWVETRETRSISYVISYETDATRALGRTRACNYYLRRAGMHPAPPGAAPRADARKARAMQLFIPLRKSLGNVVRNAFGRRALGR